MKQIVTIAAIALAFSLAGCKEDKPATQVQQERESKNLNEAVGKSTAVPTLDLPEKGKYKY